MEVDAQPDGKRIAAIFVTNLDVFGRDDGLLRLLNLFHRTTREEIIEREVLLRPGDLWDAEVAAETRRRLTDPTLSSLVVVVPVRAAQPGSVNLLVVTRDIWSLRLNSDFEYQAGVLSMLRLQPSENNLFGWRKTLVAVFDMDLGRYAVGPTYMDPNIAGTRWTMSVALRALFSRESQHSEGSSSAVTVTHPLWSYRRKWGGELSLNHLLGVVRVFQGRTLRPFDDPNTATVESIPFRYRLRSFNFSGAVTRSFGERVLQRVSVGYQFWLQRRTPYLEDFAESPAALMSFVAGLPRSERSSSVGLTYRLSTTSFVVLRDVDTFDLAEDTNVGPTVTASVFRGLQLLGSERDYWRLSVAVGWTLAPRRALAQLFAGAETRLQSGQAIDDRWYVDGNFATPPFGFLRLVGRGRVDRVVRNGTVPYLILGGETGMRGYPIGAFFGQAWFRTNLEVRTAGLPVFSTRLGAVAFWDAGHAAPDFGMLVAHHDFGGGLRLLLPQLQRSVIRFDWAFADRGPTAGFPGRLTAGFTQAF